MNSKNIVLAGVGGQGILLAADIIALAAFNSNFDVKKSEIHGMSQRGGSVTSSVKFGEKVYSPIITNNEADILLAFEKLEALRQIHLLKDDGLCVVNDLEIDPLTVISGVFKYPDNIIESLKEKVKKENFFLINALKIAKDSGNLKTMNIALLGSIVHKLPEIPKSAWETAIKERVPKKAIEINLEVFNISRIK